MSPSSAKKIDVEDGGEGYHDANGELTPKGLAELRAVIAESDAACARGEEGVDALVFLAELDALYPD
jgi:hypothetical protein